MGCVERNVAVSIGVRSGRGVRSGCDLGEAPALPPFVLTGLPIGGSRRGLFKGLAGVTAVSENVPPSSGTSSSRARVPIYYGLNWM